jgi:all-trans-retinol dehydrogenase (NAD+)
MSASKMSPLSILIAPLRLALLDPRVTAPLVVALLYYPERLRHLLPERLHPLISSKAVIRTLSVFLGLSILRSVNGKLSQWSANNWKKDAKFVKSQELVLISGGTSGIGKLMAEDFARRGVKVIIWDLNPPKATLRKFKSVLSTVVRRVLMISMKHRGFISTSVMLPAQRRLQRLQRRSGRSMAIRRC